MMFNIPDKYRKDIHADLKDIIPDDLKAADKKRIKDALKSVTLTYQIQGEEIPSVSDGNYICQVIQFYSMELTDIKEAAFIATIYQSVIKPFCVIRVYDTRNEVYSLATKRLNQIENNQIVTEQSLITQKFVLNVPDSARDKFLEYMDFNKTKNKQDKVNMYKEWLYKAYMIYNEKAYANVNNLLEGNFWYSPEKSEELFFKYKELVKQRESLKKAVTNAERVYINHEIKKAIQALDKKTE